MIAHRDVAEDDVAVAVEGLGVGGHREIGTERQRRLAQHRRGGVVDREQRPGGMRPRGQRLDVDDVEARLFGVSTNTSLTPPKSALSICGVGNRRTATPQRAR